MKTCSKCQETKEDSEFCLKRTSRSFQCKACKRAYSKIHYQDNKKYYQNNRDKHQERIKLFLQKLKGETPCTDCKQSYPYYVMHFDHLRDKLYNLSKLATAGSWRKVNAELEKCEIVCANCHAKRTHDRIIDHLGTAPSRKPNLGRKTL